MAISTTHTAQTHDPAVQHLPQSPEQRAAEADRKEYFKTGKHLADEHPAPPPTKEQADEQLKAMNRAGTPPDAPTF